MQGEEKLEQGSIVKERGTQFFKGGKYKQAAIQYKKIVVWLENESGLSEENEAKAKALTLAAFLNLGMCYLKSKDYSQALENCNKALEQDKNNEKALFRRAESFLGMNEFDSAREDFQMVLQLYPSNKAAKAQLAVCQQRLRQQHDRDKKTYANMFERFAERDAKIAAEQGQGGKGDYKAERKMASEDVEMLEEMEKTSGLEQNEVDKTENIEMEG